MNRPKFTAPTHEWEAYIYRFLASNPTHGECAIVKRELEQRRIACNNRINSKIPIATVKILRDRAKSTYRLRGNIDDYLYPNLCRKSHTNNKTIQPHYEVIY